MVKNLKRTLAFMLAVIMICSSTFTAYAEDGDSIAASEATTSVQAEEIATTEAMPAEEEKTEAVTDAAEEEKAAEATTKEEKKEEATEAKESSSEDMEPEETVSSGIITQPADVIVYEGEKAVFSLETQGEVKSYQWQMSKNGGKTWADLNRKQYGSSETVVIDANKKYNERYFRCVVSFKDKTKLISEAAKLSVNEIPTYPEVSFTSEEVEGVTVEVDAPEGALPKGTTMGVTKVDLNAVQDVVDVTKGIDGTVVSAVDITFKDANGNDIEPKAEINVKMTSKDIAKKDDLSVIHVDVKADEIADTDAEAEKIEAVTENDTVTFASDQFSVYAIVQDDTLVTPRTTYYFINEIQADGTSTPFAFVNKAGETVDYQICKGEEKLEDPGKPVTGLEKNFLGWFIATKDGDTYTITDEQIDFSAAHPKPATITTGDREIYVAPRYGKACIVTFWDNAKGSPESEMHIVAKRVVYLDEGGTASVKVDDVPVPTLATQALTAWTSDDYKTEQQTTYTLLEKPTWDDITQNFNLYPIFSDGHWLRFSGGPSGSGAGYRPAIFVTANTTATELASLGTVAREGYTFAGWYYDGFDEGTEAATNASGNALNASDLLSRVQNAEGDTTLYGHWSGNQVTYRVATWFENADDDGYTFGDVTSQTGTAGTTTNVTAPAVTGFTAQTIEQETIKGDGTTLINVYYKRNLYTIRFYNYRGNSEYSNLAITAKYEADIHDQWPGSKEGTESYSSAWNVNRNSNSPYVITISTMPLNGTNFYQHNDGNYSYQIKRYVQSVNGGNTFDVYNRSPFGGGQGDSISADDYMHIKGFRVNAYSSQDAQSIRNNTTGDDDAVYESSFNRSARIGSSFYSATTEDNRRTLKVYYLRNQYKIVFNTQHSTAPKVNDMTNIYYEANIATAKATEIAALNNQYKVGETRIEVTGEGTYVFQGWYDNAACLGDSYDFNQKMPAGNVTLFAKWERVWYLIDIDPRGGEILPDVNEVTYTWLQYDQKIERYNIRRDYVEATSDYSGTKYYYVSVLSDDDPNARESTGYYWSGYRKGFYIKTTDINNSDYSWWKDNGFIDTTTEYMPATTNDNYSFVGWYNRANDQVYDFESGITGETGIYAKWRRSGLFSIQYHTEDITEERTVRGLISGSLVATDASYADQATTQIAYVPEKITSTDEKAYVFVGWKLMDPKTGELVGDLYQQRDDFLVDAAYADSGHYIHLQAVYELAESNPDTPQVTSLTFNPNFPADATETVGETETVEGIPLNTKINLSQESFIIELEGEDVEDRTETIPKYSAYGYVQTGWNTKVDSDGKGIGDAFGMNDVVGVDNIEKTNNGLPNTLYAIWEKSVFHIYHSGKAGNEEGVIEDLFVLDYKDGIEPYTKADPNLLYGGYYLLGGFEAESADEDGVPTKQCLAYDGANWTWNTPQTSTKYTNIQADMTIYLKEVPATYLLPAEIDTYDKNSNQLYGLYLLSSMDDANYAYAGYLVGGKQYLNTKDNSNLVITSETVTITPGANSDFEKVTLTVSGKDGTTAVFANNPGGLLIKGDYLVLQKAETEDEEDTYTGFGISTGMKTVKCFWCTKDGVTVIGGKQRAITVKNRNDNPKIEVNQNPAEVKYSEATVKIKSVLRETE